MTLRDCSIKVFEEVNALSLTSSSSDHEVSKGGSSRSFCVHRLLSNAE